MRRGARDSEDLFGEQSAAVCAGPTRASPCARTVEAPTYIAELTFEAFGFARADVDQAEPLVPEHGTQLIAISALRNCRLRTG